MVITGKEIFIKIFSYCLVRSKKLSFDEFIFKNYDLKFELFNNELLDSLYGERLSQLGIADTILAIVEKAEL